MNKYEQICVAGEGAYGIVLKCKVKVSGDLVAIKRFKENDELDDEAHRMMQREVRILRMLKHENIIGLHETFRVKGILHIVFEFIDKCLIDLLDSHPNGVGFESARNIILQVTRAVEHCHKNNVIHRDIKPENLLIKSADNSLRLCDFGSACVSCGKSDAVLTDYVATRWYRAPELLVRFNNYGPGVDMWGIGCVMTELLIGKPIFAGNTDLDQLFIIMNTLGPLTKEQTERCFDLTGFVKFPEPSERQSLKQRLGNTVLEQQLQVLSRIFVVDATQRLTAKAALSLPWLANSSASAQYSPPEVRQMCAAKQTLQQSAGLRSSVVEKRGIGIVASSPSHGLQEADPESVSSFRGGYSAHPVTSMLNDSAESIVEEISDSSSLRDAEESSHGYSPPKTSGSADISSVGAGSSRRVVGIVAAPEKVPVPNSSLQTESPWKCQSSQMQAISQRSCEVSHPSISERLPTTLQNSCEASIMEEMSADDTRIPVRNTGNLVQKLTMPPKLASPCHTRRSKPASQVNPHIRPVSSSSVRSSDLTPIR